MRSLPSKTPAVIDAGAVTVDDQRLPGKLKAQTGLRSTDLVSPRWVHTQRSIYYAMKQPESKCHSHPNSQTPSAAIL